MHARIDNPALTVPRAMQALHALGNAAKQADVPETTLHLVEVRASQINGCGVCLDMHTRQLKHAGEPDERIHMIAAWREAPYFKRGRAGRSGAHRSRDPDRRPARPGAR